MVILEEPPSHLISSTRENFHIKDDVASFERIQQQLYAIQKSRAGAIELAQQNLQKLSRKLDLATSTTTSLEHTHTLASHPTRMLTLDREKFTLAKSINDLESTTHTLESKLLQLKEDLEMVDSEDALGDARMVAEDEVLLKLKVYRSLGIEVQQDEGGAGVFTKAVVRSQAKGDVHVVNIEPRFSRKWYADYFWRTI
ncbi:Spc24 subunit of Ndc80-domain-containing protein [Peziza echinospora]|nr:Spc24 subunit of Ndc80-domain-containing protein [Peziza echinospora]